VGGGEARFFAKDPEFVFVRSLEAVPSAGDSAPPSELYATVIGVPEPGAAQTGMPVDQVVGKLVRTQLRAIRFHPPLRAPNPFALESAIGEADPPAGIVHYVGFGNFRPTEDQILLGAEYGDDVQLYRVDDLADCLRARPPRLLVLQSLEPGRSDVVPADSRCSPRRCSRSGSRPSSPTQAPAQPLMAAKFNETLYASLDQGLSIELAVQRARAKLSYDRASICPALFVVRPGVRTLVVPPPLTGPAEPRSYTAMTHG